MKKPQSQSVQVIVAVVLARKCVGQMRRTRSTRELRVDQSEYGAMEGMQLTVRGHNPSAMTTVFAARF